jgi:PIN domain nuclease of toxin-antitoxin system
VRILLDTHVWLWMLAEPERLSDEGRARVESEDNELYLSAASAWETAIKQSLGRLRLPSPGPAYVERMLVEKQTRPLPISIRHALRVGQLPMHHRDPFDRLLVAQAQIEGLSIMTADRWFGRYDVPVLAV